MQIVHVHVQVKPGCEEPFLEATRRNARESRKEPGVVQFDVLQQEDDPTRFVLVEVYRTPEAVAAHKATAHYALWRDTVAPMMAVPRQGIRYRDCLCDETRAEPTAQGSPTA